MKVSRSQYDALLKDKIQEGFATASTRYLKYYVLWEGIPMIKNLILDLVIVNGKEKVKCMDEDCQVKMLDV